MWEVRELLFLKVTLSSSIFHNIGSVARSRHFAWVYLWRNGLVTWHCLTTFEEFCSNSWMGVSEPWCFMCLRKADNYISGRLSFISLSQTPSDQSRRNRHGWPSTIPPRQERENDRASSHVQLTSATELSLCKLSHVKLTSTTYLSLFKLSHVQLTSATDLSVFKLSHVQLTSATYLSLFKLSHVQLTSATDLSLFKLSHVQLTSATDLSLFKVSHVQLTSATDLTLFKLFGYHLDDPFSHSVNACLIYLSIPWKNLSSILTSDNFLVSRNSIPSGAYQQKIITNAI